MAALTFGFMDCSRATNTNSELYLRLQEVAISSFAREKVCNLNSFIVDSMSECHEVLEKDIGKRAGLLRDGYYASVKQRGTPLRLPDMQSFFLYSFTTGVNFTSAFLLDLQDLPEARPIDANEILGRHLPIQGPQWLCNAINAEMASVENVFCEFQDQILKPMVEKTPMDHRLLADAIAGTFVWGFFGGQYWLKEVLDQIGESLLLSGGKLDPSGTAMYQVKKSVELIVNDDVERALKVRTIFESGQ